MNVVKKVIRKLLNIIESHKRTGVSMINNGFNNNCILLKNVKIGLLRIIIYGNNNTVKIGNDCNLKKINTIFIAGNNNTVSIGTNVIFDQNVSIVVAEGTNVQIGDDCIFAKDVKIRTSDQHPIFDENNNRINNARDVKIGNHVWLGASVIVNKGCIIEDGSVVGIGSIVTKNIPSNSIAVGVPAKVVKKNIHWNDKLTL